MDIATLIAGHHALAQTAEAMLATLAATPVDVDALARHRMTLSLRVRDQLRLEDHAMTPVLSAHSAALPAAVRELIDRRARLMHRYSGHVARWNLQSVSADLPGFQDEAAALITDLFAFMAAKERTLFPYVQSLVDRTQPAPSRPAPAQPIPPLPMAS